MEEGAELNFCTENNFLTNTNSIKLPPIGWAAFSGNAYIFKFLMDKGAKWDFKYDKDQKNIFYIIATKEGTFDCLKLLLAKVGNNQDQLKGIVQNLFFQDKNGWCPLKYFLFSDKYIAEKVFANLIKSISLIEDTSKFKELNLTLDRDTIYRFYDETLNKKIGEWFCKFSSAGIFKIKNGNDLKVLTMKDIEEAKITWEKSSLFKKIEELLSKDSNKFGQTEKETLHSITEGLVLRNGLEEFNKNGNFFHKVIRQKNWAFLEIILKAKSGMALNAGGTFLSLLFKPGNEGLLEYCAQKLPKGLKDSKGMSLIHYSVLINKLDIVKILLSRGEDIYIGDSKGKKALDYAKEGSEIKSLFESHIKNKKESIQKLLLEQQEHKIKQISQKELIEKREKEELRKFKQDKIEKDKTNGSEKNKIFEEIYDRLNGENNTNETAEQICRQKNVNLVDYKKFVNEFKKQSSIETSEEEKVSISWVVGNQKYSKDNNSLLKMKFSNGVEQIICHEYKGKKYYFASTLQINDKQTQAIEKGFIEGDSKGKTGIVFPNNVALIKVKINADERLYATEAYENSNGLVLVIFDKSVNHKLLSEKFSHLKGKKLEFKILGDVLETNSSEILGQESDMKVVITTYNCDEYTLDLMGTENQEN